MNSHVNRHSDIFVTHPSVNCRGFSYLNSLSSMNSLNKLWTPVWIDILTFLSLIQVWTVEVSHIWIHSTNYEHSDIFTTHPSVNCRGFSYLNSLNKLWTPVWIDILTFLSLIPVWTVEVSHIWIHWTNYELLCESFFHCKHFSIS